MSKVEWLHPEDFPARNVEQLPTEVCNFWDATVTKFQAAVMLPLCWRLPFFLLWAPRMLAVLSVVCGFRHPRLGFMNDVKSSWRSTLYIVDLGSCLKRPRLSRPYQLDADAAPWG